MLKYAKVRAKVVNIRYRAPATYQSRPPSPPSPASIAGALAKVASITFGEGAWRDVLRGIKFATYRIVEPLTTVTYLMRRNLPPEQRKREVRKELLSNSLSSNPRRKSRRKGKEDKVNVAASADPSKPTYKKPDNVFPVGELITGELELLIIYDDSVVSPEVIKYSLLGTNVLGDNDSLITPLPTTYSEGDLRTEGTYEEVVTPYLFELRAASPTSGSYIIMRLPTKALPAKGGVKSVIKVSREFSEVVIPTEREGSIFKPSRVGAKVRGRAYLIDGEYVITT